MAVSFWDYPLMADNAVEMTRATFPLDGKKEAILSVIGETEDEIP